MGQGWKARKRLAFLHAPSWGGGRLGEIKREAASCGSWRKETWEG